MFRRHARKAITEYVTLSVGPQAAAEALGRDGGGSSGGSGGVPRLFAWAGVHEHCSWHPAHVHEHAVVSGVFYVSTLASNDARSSSTPLAAGEWFAEDPRGRLPPFTRNRLVHRPSAGELILFPPWLSHGVFPACPVATRADGGGVSGVQRRSRRIAISFNLMVDGSSSGEGGEGGADTQWEALSDVSIAMGAE